MDARNFNELVAEVKRAGFDEAAKMMVRQRNSELICGDFFTHTRSGDRYMLIRVHMTNDKKNAEAVLVRAP